MARNPKNGPAIDIDEVENRFLEPFSGSCHLSGGIRVRKTVIALIGVMSCSYVVADDRSLEENAVEWYRDEYAPIWESAEGIDPTVAASFYHHTWLDYSLMGTFVVQTDSSWVPHIVGEWVASDWTGSTLAALKAKKVNDHLVVITAKYSDRYKGGETLESCGWYTAIHLDDKWAFTNYAEIGCAAYGL